MQQNLISMKSVCLLLCNLLCIIQLNGCATGTSSLECGLESMNPSILASLDSFESAAIAIKLSNRILLQTPISEQDKWPAELYGVPSVGALFSMGISLLGSSQGTTVPTQIDPETGFPRPTSALYIFLKERERMLNAEVSRDDLRFFASQPATVIARQIPPHRRRADVQIIDDNIYRNPLMAYGVVTANRMEMLKLQQEIDLNAKGFKVCDAWVHRSSAGEIKPAACRDPALKQVNLEKRLTRPGGASTKRSSIGNVDYGNQATDRGITNICLPMDSTQGALQPADSSKNRRTRSNRSQPQRADSQNTACVNEKVIVVSEQDRIIGQKTDELETMKKNYGKLAGRVYNASVAGADFTMAAMTKIACAIVNGVRAMPNAEREIRGWRGAYNAAMLVPRIRGIINAFGYYRDNLGLQFTAYRTMYQQINGIYPEQSDEPNKNNQVTQNALQRINQAMTVMQELEPKLELLASGSDVDFSDDEIMKLNQVARLFPDIPDLEQQFMIAWGITAQQPY